MVGGYQDDSKRRYNLQHKGELDEHRKVTLPAAVSNNLENGFIIGEVIRRIITHSKAKVPSALLNVKSDYSKNTKLTNWNFIWYLSCHQGLRSTRLASNLRTESSNLYSQGRML